MHRRWKAWALGSALGAIVACGGSSHGPPPSPLGPSAEPSTSASVEQTAPARSVGAQAPEAAEQTAPEPDAHPTRDEIKSVIRDQYRGMVICIWPRDADGGVPADAPRTEFRIDVHFDIAPEGNVLSLHLTSPTGEPALMVRYCVNTVFTGLQFPKPTSGKNLHINYPLVFKP